jgi:mRNA interferase MazF
METTPFQRGTIFRVNLEPNIGSEQQGEARPCVIISDTPFNKSSRILTVVPLSSSPRPLFPLIVEAPSAGKQTSVALCNQIRAIDKRRIVSKLGTLSFADTKMVEKAIKIFLKLS